MDSKYDFVTLFPNSSEEKDFVIHNGLVRALMLLFPLYCSKDFFKEFFFLIESGNHPLLMRTY